MELIIIGLALVIGVAWWMYNNHDKVEDIVEEVEDAVDEIEDKIDEVKQKVKDKLDDIPTKEELKKLTKAKLEELGRDLGVELDKRKTKDNMIKELNEKLSK
jgi:ABC-type nitrate/sulfonate/bicarbonate transport system substrate-binding protein